MIRIIVVGVLTLLVLIFQNCSTGKSVSVNVVDDGRQNLKNNINEVQVVPIEIKSALNLIINNVRNTQAMNPKDLLNRPDIYFYLINLKDGKIQGFDINETNLNVSFCLSSADRAELTNILSTAKLCEPTSEAINSKKDAFCSAEYVMPYAKIQFDQQKIYSLGERNSGCDIPTDLCGDHSSLLKGFVRNLLLNIKSKVCDI